MSKQYATPIVDKAAEAGEHMGLGRELMSNIWGVSRQLERDRAELIEAVQWLLSCMKLAGWEDDAAAIKARSLLSRLEGK